jgi:hypothetical protein
MKEEWLFPGAFVPVDVETTSALVAEVKRLIDVVGGLVLKQGPDYERGFIDGMQKQMQSSVDKAVNAMAQPEQEPVAWLEPEWGEKICPEVGYEATITDDHPRDLCWIPLYTTPPQRIQQEPTGLLHIDRLGGWLDASLKERKQRTWVGLTEKEVEDYWDWEDFQCGAGRGTILEMVRDIEAKLKEKNV